MNDEHKRAFFGTDLLAGEEALEAIAKDGPDVIREFLGPGRPEPAWNTRPRLARLCSMLGPDVVPHLIHAIETAEWHTKLIATPCFAAFRGNRSVGERLYRLLDSDDIDVQRLAIEALGYAAYSEGWGIRDTTRYGSPDRSSDFVTIDKDTFGKLLYYALVALIRLFAHHGSAKYLEQCEALLEDAKEVRKGDDYSWDIDRCLAELQPGAADALIARWLRHADVYFRRHALVGLAALRLRRTARVLSEALRESDASEIAATAGIALGGILTAEAATYLADLISKGHQGNGVQWAFSLLYGLGIGWPDHKPLMARIVARNDEVTTQFRYSAACRGDRSVMHSIVERLDAEDPFVRGASALSLVRLSPQDARVALAGREREISKPIEGLLLLSAKIHLGEHRLVSNLDRYAQEFESLPMLRPIWKREVLGAFAVAENDGRRAALWAEVANESMEKVVGDLQSIGVVIEQGAAEANLAPAASAKMSSATVFVSYSHKDKSVLEEFQIALRPLTRKGVIDLWDDTKLQPGSRWKEEIDQAMRQAGVALFLVSRNFLNSEFITRHELSTLLEAARTRGVRVIWVAVDHCLYEDTELAGFQAANNPTRPLSDLAGNDRDREIVEICRKVRDVLTKS
ncbi:MAG: TIR domain-containing protein [Alphaproteobacteria bacterium]